MLCSLGRKSCANSSVLCACARAHRVVWSNAAGVATHGLRLSSIPEQTIFLTKSLCSERRGRTYLNATLIYLFLH